MSSFKKIKFSTVGFYQGIAIVGLILLLLKMASMGYYGSRFFDIKGAPFTEIGHEGFHRFMDWILVYDVSNYKDFYDILSPQYNAPPVPYSILVFWFMKIGWLFKSAQWYLYLSVIAAYVYTSYLLMANVLKYQDKEYKIFLFLALIASSYPLWYAIDRGNLDLLAVIIFNCIVLNEIDWKKHNLTVILIALIISLKPSWGMFALLLLLYPTSIIQITTILCIIVVYILPMVIWGHNYDYLILLIRKAYPMISGMNFLCNNITCSIRVFTGIPNDIHDKIITIIGICSITLLFVYMKFINKKMSFHKKLIVMLISIYICTLLINNPSADFRLNIFFALVIFTFSKLKSDVYIFKTDYILLFLGYIFVFGFTSIPFKNFFNYFTILRTVGVILLGYMLLKLTLDDSLTTNDK